MTRLRIGMVAPPWVPVPPPQYGGTETVVDALALGLAAAGHEVVLFATGDSTCPVPTLYSYPRALGTTASAEAELYHVEQAYAAFDGKVDVIHDHTLVGPLHRASHPGPTPIVTTVHGPFTAEMTRHYELIGQHAAIVAISSAQAASAPTVKVAAVIHHGVDLTHLPLGDGGGGYVAFLGRMNPDKGPHRAIAAARRAGVPVRLAAKMWEPAERRFFAEEVEPLLGGDATYVGELGQDRKADFLGRAVALLNPIRWPEPFGLVMVEALACGTPVLAFAEGAAPEIVRPGVNGFICADEGEMAEAIVRSRDLDRGTCRAEAVARFGVGRMVADYVDLYHRLIREARTATPPVLSGGAGRGAPR